MDDLRERLAVEGARRCVTRQDVERLGRAMLARGRATKTVRSVMTFLHAVFVLALANEWIERNPVAGAARPKRRRQGDAYPDLQFLTVEQPDLVLAAIPDQIVAPAPPPTRRGRAGPGPPSPPDVLGPVLRVLTLAAAFTGLRQSELIGPRWKDVDRESQRIRVRNAVVRGSTQARVSRTSTRRCVQMTERLRSDLERWRGRSSFAHADGLVVAHPQLGTRLERTNVTRRFQAACNKPRSGDPVHDLRHTFATQIYAHYARSAWGVDMVEGTFGPRHHEQ